MVEDRSAAMIVADAPIDVLHITFVYWPEALGGTEIYVKTLVAELGKLGIRSAIAAPAQITAAFEFEGTPVRTLAANLNTEQLYGQENTELTAAWLQIVQELGPKIVHIHARTPALHSRALEQFRALGIKTLFTVHTPTAFCQRGTMLELGRQPCDGKVSAARCGVCSLHGMGLPISLAKTIPKVPKAARRFIARLGSRRLTTALSFPERIERALAEQRNFFGTADQLVAVCDWLAAALDANQFSSSALIRNRQGVRSDLAPASAASARTETRGVLKLFALGRPDPGKGFECLTDAVLACSAPVELELALACNEPDHPWVQQLRFRIAQHANAGRIRLYFNASAAELAQHFAACDLVAVPSVWLETGPLTVLEAFSQGKPVMGSRRGGIAELVRDGVDGWLVEANASERWREQLEWLAARPALITEACMQIRPVRTMAQVALEHLRIYRALSN